MPKPSLLKNNCNTILPIPRQDKGVHTILNGISLKMYVTVWLEFELVYYEVAVQPIWHGDSFYSK